MLMRRKSIYILDDICALIGTQILLHIVQPAAERLRRKTDILQMGKTRQVLSLEPVPLPKVDAKLIKDTRERLHCSRAVFARKLHINERTLEKWEQGRAQPNPQAAALLKYWFENTRILSSGWRA